MAADFAALLWKRLAGRSQDEQKFLIVAAINECLRGGSQAVLVGGSLVQLYTMGAITSLDVDIVADRRQVKAMLESAGFIEGPLSMWKHPEYAPIINIVAAELAPTERIERVEFDGYEVPCASAEDCLIDRLAGGVFWSNPTDWERAVVLARVLRGRLDLDRLRARAKEERLSDALEEVLVVAQS